MSRDSRFERIMQTNLQYQDRRESNKKLAFERKIVRKLLDCANVHMVQRKVWEAQYDTLENEDYYMTFGWFTAEFADFPFIPVACDSWVPRLYDVLNPSKQNSVFWMDWKDLKDMYPDARKGTRQFALFVPCSQESGLSPALVIHNATLPDGPYESNVPNQVRVRWMNSSTGEVVYVQSFKYFMAQLRLVWQP